MRGPLAPKRDVGERSATYGTISTNRLRMPKVLEDKRTRFQTIAPGDRVCMVKGKDKGKIGKVLNLDPETESVTVEGINIVRVSWGCRTL